MRKKMSHDFSRLFGNMGEEKENVRIFLYRVFFALFHFGISECH